MNEGRSTSKHTNDKRSANNKGGDSKNERSNALEI